MSICAVQDEQSAEAPNDTAQAPSGLLLVKRAAQIPNNAVDLNL